jgi:hypothetical protein
VSASKLFVSSTLVLALGIAIVSCKSTGQGMGESHPGDIKATFTWEQSAPTSGTLLVIAYPLGGALTLAVLVGILFVADGALRVAFGMSARPVVGWGWLVAGGIGSLLVGVILLLGWPATALWATGLLLGINLIFTGLTRITLALTSRTALVHRPARTTAG